MNANTYERGDYHHLWDNKTKPLFQVATKIFKFYEERKPLYSELNYGIKAVSILIEWG